MLFDNVAFHLASAVLHKAEAMRIEIITYPSNATHKMQPHDVLAFKTYNDVYEKLKRKRRKLGLGVCKLTFLSMLDEARSVGMRRSNIIKSFEKTGIWPIDPTKIPRIHLAPTDRVPVQEEATPQRRMDAFERKLLELPRLRADVKEDLWKMFRQELDGRLQAELDNVGKDTLIEELRSSQKRKRNETFVSQPRRWNPETLQARKESRPSRSSRAKGKQRATEAEIAAEVSEEAP